MKLRLNLVNISYLSNFGWVIVLWYSFAWNRFITMSWTVKDDTNSFVLFMHLVLLRSFHRTFCLNFEVNFLLHLWNLIRKGSNLWYFFFFFLNVQVRDLRCVHECMLVHAFLLWLFSYMNFISCLSSQFFKVVKLSSLNFLVWLSLMLLKPLWNCDVGGGKRPS